MYCLWLIFWRPSNNFFILSLLELSLANRGVTQMSLLPVAKGRFLELLSSFLVSAFSKTKSSNVAFLRNMHFCISHYVLYCSLKSWDYPVFICCFWKLVRGGRNFNHISSVTRQKGQSQDGGTKKIKQAKFSEKLTFLTPWYAHVRMRICPFALLPTIFLNQ